MRGYLPLGGRAPAAVFRTVAATREPNGATDRKHRKGKPKMTTADAAVDRIVNRLLADLEAQRWPSF
jgi:hypothetical protein